MVNEVHNKMKVEIESPKHCIINEADDLSIAKELSMQHVLIILVGKL